MNQLGESSNVTANLFQHFQDAERRATAASASPDVVVLDRLYDDVRDIAEAPLSTSQDLWLSTVDGRYSTHPIPVRVGSMGDMQIFYVHKDVLIKAKWFRKALCGGFKEADEQVIDLPEEDPAIFHFLVAFLYEQRFNPIMPAAAALESEVDKGKGKNVDKGKGLDVDQAQPMPPVPTVTVQLEGQAFHTVAQQMGRPVERYRLPGGENTLPPTASDKRPGCHRSGCRCPQCLSRRSQSRCWHCGASGSAPLPNGPGYAQQYRLPHNPPPAHGAGTAAGMFPAMAALGTPSTTSESSARIKGEDMRTWLMTYELVLDVYICANRYLMDDFRDIVSRAAIDMLETAGNDAAHPTVLRLCQKLLASVPETDRLLKMILARVGFLQPLIWKRSPEETNDFLLANPELVTLMLKETVLRHQASSRHPDLPSMERGLLGPVAGREPHRQYE